MEQTFKNYRKMKISTLLSISLIDKNTSELRRPEYSKDCSLINLKLKMYKDVYGFTYIYPSNYIHDNSGFFINHELISVVDFNYYINSDCHQKHEIPLTTGCQFGYTKGFSSELPFITATISRSVLSGKVGDLTFWVHNPKDGVITRIEGRNQSILVSPYSIEEMCSAISLVQSDMNELFKN